MKFTTSSLDTCRRYLCADLHETPSRHHAAYGGHFGWYLKEQFGIERLPYCITIVEMLERGMIKPDLLIKFPKNANGKSFSDFYKKVSKRCPIAIKDGIPNPSCTPMMC